MHDSIAMKPLREETAQVDMWNRTVNIHMISMSWEWYGQTTYKVWSCLYIFIFYIVYALHALAIVDCAIPFSELS